MLFLFSYSYSFDCLRLRSGLESRDWFFGPRVGLNSGFRACGLVEVAAVCEVTLSFYSEVVSSNQNVI